jgi:hypothetical protein
MVLPQADPHQPFRPYRGREKIEKGPTFSINAKPVEKRRLVLSKEPPGEPEPGCFDGEHEQGI